MIFKVNNKEYEINYIKVESNVRYLEDADINGEADISFEEQQEGVESRMPFVEKREERKGYLKPSPDYYWCPLIDINNGKIVDWPLGQKSVVNIHYKTCDENKIWFYKEIGGDPIVFEYEGKQVDHYDGYVPSILDTKKDGYGDYIIIDIIDDGYISQFEPNRIIEILDGSEQNFA